MAIRPGAIAGLVAKQVTDVTKNFLANHCTFYNDTKYQVKIVDYDGTRTLSPGTSQGNYLVAGPWSVDLVMKLSDTEEAKINFPGSRFENRTHNMGRLFADHIIKFESSQIQSSVIARSGVSIWKLVYSHPGGYENTVKVKMATKNSWKDMQEKGYEAEAKVGGMIKAIELSASLKAYTKLTRVDECESQISRSEERRFKDACYLWQEIVVVKTNQKPPFDELQIPTNNTAMTLTSAEPGKDMLLFSKGY